MKGRKLNFPAIARTALLRADVLVPRWLSDGHRQGHEWVARNPRRNDRHVGSFKINLRSGRWADFAAGDAGGDLVSLLAFLRGWTQSRAALEILRKVDGESA